MGAIWIVVADSSRARIFSADNGNADMIEIRTLAHPEARLHEGDLVSDKDGRERSNVASSHNMAGEHSAKEAEEMRFAGQVCQALESGRTSGEFDRFHIIAAPGFLGSLRKQLSGSLQKLVGSEVAKNLATHSLSDIRRQ